MTVRIYRWDDASAPVLNGNAGSYTIVDVLDKCLVTGYGAKAGAGWTKPFTGTGKAAFKQGAGSNQMYCLVDASASSQYPRFRGYETMTDIATGTNPFPNDTQLSGGGYMATSSTADAVARPWVVVADEKRFYLYIGFGETTAAGLVAAAYRMLYFFGDLIPFKSGDAYATTILCSTSAATTTNLSATVGNQNTAQAGHYTARSHTQIGSSITSGKMHDAQRANGAAVVGGGGGPYPDPVTGGMVLQPILSTDNVDNITRGYYPGLWSPMHLTPGNPGDTFSGAGAMAGKQFLLLWVGAAASRICIETSDTWS